MDLRERLASVSAARGPGRPGYDPLARFRQPAVPFVETEEHLALDDLGLRVVGRGPLDAVLLAQLGLRGEAPGRWQEIVFLDTETSGLAGGAGTYVFLLGTVEVGEGELVLRQHALFDLGAERSYVDAVRAHLGRFRACASYNGKRFDLPLLKDRVMLHFRATLDVDASHVDLLHPARRWWRERAGTARLARLEDVVLADPRTDDLPGELIPRTYFTFLSTRDPALLRPVAAHNRRDLLALVRLADRMALGVAAARAGRTPVDPGEALGMAAVFERAGEHETAASCYEAAFHDGTSAMRRRSAIPYARALERAGRGERAIAVLETALALEAGDVMSWRRQIEGRLRRLLRHSWTTRAGRRSRASRRASSTASAGVLA